MLCQTVIAYLHIHSVGTKGKIEKKNLFCYYVQKRTHTRPTMATSRPPGEKENFFLPPRAEEVQGRRYPLTLFSRHRIELPVR